MSLKIKWRVRQFAVELFSYILCFTTFAILVPVTIKCRQFYETGLDMFPRELWPPSMTLSSILDVFWQQSLWPILMWLPLAVAADVVLRQRFFRLCD